MNFRRKR